MKQETIIRDREAILKARARELARKPEKSVTARDCLEMTEFLLAAETYGIESSFVREVFPLKDFTPLPGVPDFVIGVVNMHGQILSVVDLKKFFNLPGKGLSELNKVIVIRNNRMEFGILADSILGTRSVALDAIQAVPATVTGIGAGYLKGVTDDRTVMLDAQKIADDEKIIVNESVADYENK